MPSSSTSSTSSTSLTSPSSTSSTPDSTSHIPPTQVVTQSSTATVTAPGLANSQQPTPSAVAKPKGSSTTSIAAGVVVGIAAISALAGGLFFFLRNRKRRALEDEFHRNSANTFLANGKIPDARLDPSVMMQRRQSDGSIADNRDYSRRILKVGQAPSSYIWECGLTVPGHEPGRDLIFIDLQASRFAVSRK